MNTVILQAGVDVIVEQSTLLDATPVWSLEDGDVLVGPFSEMDEHESLYLATVGSGTWYWGEYDEFRFDRKTLKLVSLWFHIPEVIAIKKNDVESWLSVESDEGNISLLSPRNWDQEITDATWFDPEGKHLICVTNFEQTSENIKRRITVAKDLDLLVVDNCLVGWMLNNPMDHLLTGDDSFVADKFDRVFSTDATTLVYDLLNVVTVENTYFMDRGDEAILEKLKSLYDRATRLTKSEPYVEFLADWLIDLVDRFYRKDITQLSNSSD